MIRRQSLPWVFKLSLVVAVLFAGTFFVTPENSKQLSHSLPFSSADHKSATD